MKISHNKPPHYLLLVLFFGFDWSRHIATFGDTVYVNKHELPSHLIVHERTHLEQQRYSKLYAVWWWIRYFLSKSFRYRQELEAYRKQWVHFLTYYSRAEHEAFLNKITSDLSGAMYGNIVSYYKARKAIQKI